MPLGLIVGLGRAVRRKRTSSLGILSSKRGPGEYYNGKNCKPIGFHTRKGGYVLQAGKLPRYVVPDLTDFKELANLQGPSSLSLDSKQPWQKVWNAWTLPRVRTFAWAGCQDILPSKEKLFMKRAIQDPLCCFCARKETLIHALKDCRHARSIWRKCPVEIDLSSTATSFQSWVLEWKDRDERDFAWLITYAWAIWRSRNYVIFQGKNQKPSSLRTYIEKLLTCYWEDKQKAMIGPSSRTRWLPPEEGWWKINTDAGRLGPRKWGIGMATRDSRGFLSCCAGQLCEGNWEVEEVEAQAIVVALRMALEEGLRFVEVESDCLALIEKVRSKNRGRGELLEEISELADGFGGVRWSHVGRQGNKMANALAQRVGEVGSFKWSDSIPQDLISMAMDDVAELPMN